MRTSLRRAWPQRGPRDYPPPGRSQEPVTYDWVRFLLGDWIAQTM
jgi:hypothetical protein